MLGWSDVGSWDFVWKISKDSNGNVIKGNVIEKNNKNSFINSNSRLIAAIGLTNIVVVETRDAILIANKDQSQEKNIVKIMKEKNISQGVEHQKSYRPWGTC